MTNSIQAPPHQAITQSSGAIVEVMGDINLLSTFLKKMSVGEIIKRTTTSKVWNDASKDILKKIKQFLDTLTMLKNDKVISEKLFSEIRKDIYLKSPNPIVCETFLTSLTQFREIAAKINTQIQTLQNADPEIDIDKLNNLKDKFLESLILNPNIIGTINPAKIELIQSSESKYYLGEIENRQPNGYGACNYANDARYVGEWLDGQPNRQGTKTWSNGDRYVGEWLDGKRHGQGIYIWSNGDRYDGEWNNGNHHGQGLLTKENGDKYEGEFQNGKANGQGTLSDKDGNVIYDGKWENGKFIG